MVDHHRGILPAVTLAVLLACICPGCAFGPKALERTHGRYNDTVRLVYEEQLLANLVHARYNEAPAALDIASISAQYELSAQAEARPFFIAPNPSNSNVIFKTFTAILPDFVLSGTDRPTLTLTPEDDSEAVKRFLTPIPEDTLIFLTQTGWPVSGILRLWVGRLNGVPNAGPARCAVEDFVRFNRVAELFQIAQDRELLSLHAEDRLTEVGSSVPAAAVTAAAQVDAAKNGLEYQVREGGKSYALLRKQRRLVLQVNPAAAGSAELTELAQLLNLVPGLARYEVLVAAGVPDPLRQPGPPSAEIRVQLRSTAQVFAYLANGVTVPTEHLRCGLAHVAAEEATRGLFEVHVAQGFRPPPCAYVAVKYRGYWYYLDDRDAQSKTTLALMLQLSRLDFGVVSHQSRAPALTLPVGR
jgi:hypothetical protein